MKKIILTSFLLLFVTSAMAQTEPSGKFRFGVGTYYFSEIESTSLSFKAIFEYSEKWEGALTYSNVFENEGLTWNMLDLDGQYVFQTEGKLKPYALSGIAMTFWKQKVPLAPDDDGVRVGWNVGVGANYPIGNRLYLAPEIKFSMFKPTFFRGGISLQYRF